MNDKTKCPSCGQPAEHRTCDTCGTSAWVLDCGDYRQPAEISADTTTGEHICDMCYGREG
jgi:hypothetical protein